MSGTRHGDAELFGLAFPAEGWVGPKQAATAQGPWKVDLVLTIAGHLAIA